MLETDDDLGAVLIGCQDTEYRPNASSIRYGENGEVQASRSQ